MPAKVPPEVRITRTPLAGGAGHVVQEVLRERGRVVKSIQVTHPQSIAAPEARVALRNNAGTFDAWTLGDTIVVEARVGATGDPASLGSRGFLPIFRGFIAEPSFQPAQALESTLSLHCRGFIAVLDLITISEEVGELSYPGEWAWTDIAEDVLSVLCPGWTRNITPDAASATDVSFQVGMSLGQVLQVIRSGLNSGTAKWEQNLDISTGTGIASTYTLAPRQTSLQATYSREAALPGSMHAPGSVDDVVNYVTLTGATSIQYLLDYVRETSEAGASVYDLNDPLRRVAQGFTALDTPLYSVAAMLARGPVIPSTALTGKVMRGSDGYDVLTESIRRRFLPTATFTNHILGITNPTEAQIGPLDDRNAGTTVDFAVNSILAQIIRLDFPTKAARDGTVLMPSKANRLGQIVLQVTPPVGGTWRVVVESSDDGATWETVLDQSGTTTAQQAFGTGSGINFGVLPVDANGYHLRVKASCDVSGTLQIHELRFIPLGLDRYTGASSPSQLDLLNGNNWVVNTNPGTQNPIATFTPAQRKIGGVAEEANRIFLAKFSHQSSLTNFIFVRVSWQVFGVGTQFLDFGTPVATTIDNFLVFRGEALPSNLTFEVLDIRGSGGAGTTTISNVRLYEHVENVEGAHRLVPVEPDNVPGGETSWQQGELQSTFSAGSEKTYSDPNVALDSVADVGTVGGPRTPNELSSYFFVWVAPTSASASAYDRVQLNTVASDDRNPALASTDGGATWFVLFGNDLMRVRSRFGFNFSAARASATDPASYAAWSNLVPGGVLRASFQDEGVVGPDAAAAVASAILQRRKAAMPRLVLAVDGDPGLRPGRPIRLLAPLAQAFGLPAADVDADVVSVDHAILPGSFRTTMRLMEHGFLDDLAFASLATMANQRGI